MNFLSVCFSCYCFFLLLAIHSPLSFVLLNINIHSGVARCGCMNYTGRLMIMTNN